MDKKHAKSPCCRGKIIYFGNRRRQCVVCKKTWRIRIKKRGRKCKRASAAFADKYIRHEIPSLYAIAKRCGGEGRLKARLRRSLDKFVAATLWPVLPTANPLIVVADSMRHTIGGKVYSTYFILVRPINSSEALITPPFIKTGTESWSGWQEAFAKLPEPVMASICAIVADRHIGLKSIAKKRGWLFQGCHFHALARLMGRRSRSRWSRHRETGKRIYEITINILRNPDEEIVQNYYIPQLIEIGKTMSSPKARSITSGFTKEFSCYRTHLYHPELHLPTTSNSVESLNSSFRDLCRRTRGFRTLPSFTKWLYAFLKQKQKIKCNGRLPTKFPS